MLWRLLWLLYQFCSHCARERVKDKGGETRGRRRKRGSNRWHQKFIRDARYRLQRTPVSQDRSTPLIVTSALHSIAFSFHLCLAQSPSIASNITRAAVLSRKLSIRAMNGERWHECFHHVLVSMEWMGRILNLCSSMLENVWKCTMWKCLEIFGSVKDKRIYIYRRKDVLYGKREIMFLLRIV